MTTERTPPPPRYMRDVAYISPEDAENEPEEERLFPSPPKTYPQIELRTTVEYDGFTFEVTFRDTPIADAAAVLRKRGCTPATPPPPPSGGAVQTTTGGVPICPIHKQPMKPMQHADRAGRTHWCTQKTDDGYCKERA